MGEFKTFSGRDGQPTALERELIEASWDGRMAWLPGAPDHPDVQVSAALVAALATDVFEHPDWPDWKLHPGGLELKNATLLDRLNLAHCHVKGRLALINCRLKQAFDASSARFDEGLWLDGSELDGECDLSDTVLAGQFNAIKTTFRNPGSRAIFAQRVKATDWFMDGARVEGAFDINSAELAGQFGAGAADGQRAEFLNEHSHAIFAQDVKASAWFMYGARVKGIFNIAGAELTGPLVANAVDGQRAEFLNERGDAIVAHSLKATHWFMDGARVEGIFNIAGAELTGQLAAVAANGQRAEFIHPAGRAIIAAEATVRGGVLLYGPGTNEGPLIEGECYLAGAVFGKDLDFSNATFKASRHRAINLRGAEVRGDVIFDGTTVFGHVNANRARFGGRVGMVAGRFKAASLARRDGEIPWPPHSVRTVRDEQRQDASLHHALVFREARIEGRLVMPDQLPEGIVDLSRTTCDTLEDKATGWPAPIDTGCLDCKTRLRIEDEAEHGAGKSVRDVQHLVLDGFTYTHLEYPDGTVKGGGDAGAARARWLSGQAGHDLKTHFNPQPWRQCAQTLRAMGYDEAAQHVSIERRVRERHADGTRWLNRLTNRALHLVADYGYRPWKTVAWSIGVILFSAALFAFGERLCGTELDGRCGGHSAFVQTRFADFEGKDQEPRKGYPPFNAVYFALDQFVPLLDLGMEGYWRANPKAEVSLPAPLVRIGSGPEAVAYGSAVPLGSILYVLGIVQTILGSILIAITVTGFTGLLTRDDR